MIACLLFPYFAAALAQRDDPSLAHTPLIIGGQPWEQKTVYAVSREAARMGVKPGSSLQQAQAICPAARFIPHAQQRDQRVFEQILDCLAAFTPFVEQDEGLWQTTERSAGCYLDLRKLSQSEALDKAQHIVQAVKEHFKLALVIGLAGNKFSARVAAASARQNRALLVSPGQEAAFLEPFPVTLLPLDDETVRQLSLLGIYTLGQFAALPAGAVLARFGKTGQLGHQLARGQDSRPVLTYQPRDIEQVARSFDSPVTNRTLLEAVLLKMVQTLAKRLGDRDRMGRELTLLVHLENRTLHEKGLVLRQPTAHPDRLAGALNLLLKEIAPSCGIVGLEITLGALTPLVAEQLSLFVDPADQKTQFQDALKNLAALYGDNCFYWTALNPAARLPERRFQQRKAVCA